MARINKEKEGKTMKTTVRIPVEYYAVLKRDSNSTKGDKGNFVSMNDIICKAIEKFYN